MSISVIVAHLGHVVDGAGEAVAEVIRCRVREETRLTCSCGIGPNRLLSKVFPLCVLLIFHESNPLCNSRASDGHQVMI